ncbi:hypothetical protein JTE90_005473 [Oedothorax gibbosus]|uniref:BTB domain-containing protein n=1 Tax=Oedothorax gibbosus TaxID=931172 RepID=A0AAV6UM57_9ARAC|nr:hypothetical protein JTE90_005473 [Oedothorax gibbosus]
MSREGKLKCFTVTWRIANFSFYSLAGNKDLSSPAWNTKTKQGSEWWKLGVYISESNICFRLINLKGDVNIDHYEITLLTSNGEILLKSLSTNLFIPCIAKINILDDKGVSVLPQDILTISCRILKQTVLSGIFLLSTALKKVKCVWKIKDFADNNFYLSISRALHEEGNILLGMFFSDYDSKGTFNVQVELLPNMSGWSTLIDCHINIKDGLEKAISVVRGSQSFWSFEIKIKSEASTKLQVELESLIALNLTFQKNPTSSVGDDIVFLLKEGLHSDATLNTEKKSFKAHKSFLAARSSVFRAIVEDDGGLTDDRWWAVVEIDDVDSLTLERILVFMHTDLLETMDWDEVKNGYYAAEKYAVHPLKRRSVDILKSNIAVSNVCEALVVGG